MTQHRGFGTSAKTVLTDVGSVEVEVPRDRNGAFEPRIAPKDARRLSGFDEQVLARYACGMTVCDIRSYLAKVYDTEVSPDLISKVTGAVSGEITAWQSRPRKRGRFCQLATSSAITSVTFEMRSGDTSAP
ncbi:transposase [Streptomyces sp. QH1-20]|uniref:transposase n=1 Tax=Streptomyces sp. QH1-20 TaxID=3240934 RepID=UPI003511B2BB